MEKYVIYGKSEGCVWCDRAKDALSNHIVEFIEVSDRTSETFVDLCANLQAYAPEVMYEIMEGNKKITVPQIFLAKDGNVLYIGGYDELNSEHG